MSCFRLLHDFIRDVGVDPNKVEAQFPTNDYVTPIWKDAITHLSRKVAASSSAAAPASSSSSSTAAAASLLSASPLPTPDAYVSEFFAQLTPYPDRLMTILQTDFSPSGYWPRIQTQLMHTTLVPASADPSSGAALPAIAPPVFFQSIIDDIASPIDLARLRVSSNGAIESFVSNRVYVPHCVQQQQQQQPNNNITSHPYTRATRWSDVVMGTVYTNAVQQQPDKASIHGMLKAKEKKPVAPTHSSASMDDEEETDESSSSTTPAAAAAAASSSSSRGAAEMLSAPRADALACIVPMYKLANALASTEMEKQPEVEAWKKYGLLPLMLLDSCKPTLDSHMTYQRKIAFNHMVAEIVRCSGAQKVRITTELGAKLANCWSLLIPPHDALTLESKEKFSAFVKKHFSCDFDDSVLDQAHRLFLDGNTRLAAGETPAAAGSLTGFTRPLSSEAAVSPSSKKSARGDTHPGTIASSVPQQASGFKRSSATSSGTVDETAKEPKKKKPHSELAAVKGAATATFTPGVPLAYSAKKGTLKQ